MSQHRQFGIRAKLFIAFAAVSGTTVIAGVAGWLMFSQVRDLFHGVAGQNIPEIVATLGLQTETQTLAASAPALLAARSQAQRQEAIVALKARQDSIAKRLDLVAGFQSDKQAVDRLKSLNASLNEKLAALDGVVDNRLKLTGQGEAIVKSGAEIQSKVNQVLLPSIEKAQGAITVASMNVSGEATQSTMSLLRLVSRDVPLSQGFGDLLGLVNLASGMLNRAAVAPVATDVDAFEKDFKAMAERVDEKLDIVDTLQPTDGLRKQVEAWLAQGKGDNTIFANRRKELSAQQAGQKLLAETGGITVELAAEVARQVKGVDDKTRQATERSDAAIDFGTFVMLAIALASMVGSGLFVWLYIGRNLVARLVGLEKTMTRLAGGDLNAEVTSQRSGDEIGQMAGALAVFREGIVQANAAAAAQVVEQQAKQRHAATLATLTSDFGDGATTTLAAVSAAAAQMKGAAERMSSVAAQAKDRTDAVATASAQAATNVQTVAAATEELSSSISEISRQVSESIPHRIASSDAGVAERADRHRTGAGREPDRRSGRSHQYDCRADQSAGAERHHRGGPRGRSRQGICRGGFRGEEPGDPDGQGHRRHYRAGCGDPGIDPRGGRYHQGNWRDHRPHVGDRDLGRGRRRATGQGDRRDRPQHSAGCRRNPGSILTHCWRHRRGE